MERPERRVEAGESGQLSPGDQQSRTSGATTASGTPQSLGVSSARLVSAGQIDTGLAKVAFQREAALLDLMQEAIVVRDAATDVVAFWNRGAEAVYGWPRAEIVGKSARDVLQRRFPQPLETIEAILRRDGCWEGELDQIRRDGRAITVASRWASQRDGQGRAVAILESSTDITARRALERAARERDVVAEATQRLNRLGSFHWDFATDAVHWSDEMFRLLDRAPGQVTPSFASFLGAVHLDDRALIRVFMQGAYSGRTAPVEFRTVGPRGVVRTLHAQTEVVCDATGTAKLIFGISFEIGAATAVRRALRRGALRRGAIRVEDGALHLLHPWATEPEGRAKLLVVALTAREREVLQLLAQGLTNRQIGHARTLSVATVNTHVEHILAKLKVTDRTQAAVRGIELGLVTLARS